MQNDSLCNLMKPWRLSIALKTHRFRIVQANQDCDSCQHQNKRQRLAVVFVHGSHDYVSNSCPNNMLITALTTTIVSSSTNDESNSTKKKPCRFTIPQLFSGRTSLSQKHTTVVEFRVCLGLKTPAHCEGKVQGSFGYLRVRRQEEQALRTPWRLEPDFP